MFKKIIFFIIVLTITLTINGCINKNVNSDQESTQINSNSEITIEAKETLIGGNRDEHGCLGSAGYTWNEDLGFCLREWELDDSQRKATQIAIEVVDDFTTVVEVLGLRCPGCFKVKLQNNNSQEMIEINIENWEIKE